MAVKKGAKDQLARALEETPVAGKHTSPSDVSEQPTPRAQPVGQLLESLQAQAKDAMRDSFFDDGATTKTTPVVKRMRSEVGTVEFSAKRRDTNLQASVAIDVRCDRDEKGDAGRYQVRAEGHVARESEEGLVVEANVPVSVEVHDADGGLKLDTDEMRHDIANAIRSTGAARARSVSPRSRARRTRVRRGRHVRALPHVGERRARLVADCRASRALRQRVRAGSASQLESGRELRTLEGHASRVDAVAVTPDGRRAVSAPADQTVKVWELESSATIADILMRRLAQCCAVANDCTIVAGDQGGRIRILALER